MDDVKKRVLIVDDEEDLTWSISKRLSRDSAFMHVMSANSGINALDILSKYRVDLMVTDLRMPGVDGFNLLKEVKIKYPQTRVIIMTAYGSAEFRETLKHWGRVGYIEKPFEINDLMKLIFHFLEEQEWV